MSNQASGEASKSIGQLAECHGEPFLDLDHSMWEMFNSTANKYPHRDAVVSLWQPPFFKSESKQQGQEPKHRNEVESVFHWSYEELQFNVELLAGWLQSQGCAEGENLASSPYYCIYTCFENTFPHLLDEPVKAQNSANMKTLQVTFVWNSAEWVLFFWAAVRMKMTFVPLDPRTIELGIDDYLSRLAPSVIVVQDEAAASTLEKAASQLQQSKVRICCAESPANSWTSLSNLYLLEIDTKPFVESVSPGQDTALIVFTSGTTSTPKGCCHTSANLWSESYDYDPDTDKRIGEKWLIHTPTSHIFAVNNCLRSFRYGGTVVFASKTFDIHASLKALELHQCTRMSAIPTLVQGLLSLPKFPGKEKLALNYVTIGGTLIKEEDIQMCKRLGSNSVIQAYGMSEGAPITSWLRDDPLIKSGQYVFAPLLT
jgi:acyl-CoA synthetase (AMP-forming)/AMP-acid ligase II